jgi:hypothetical protein
MMFDDDADTSGVLCVPAAPDVAGDGTRPLPVPCANTNALQSTRRDRYPNRWRKGQSGNPNDRPLGSRHRATVLAESLLDGQTKELIQKTIDLALAGDPTALRLCLERVIAPRRDRPVSFRLPPMNCAADAVGALASIADGVAMGELTPAEAADLTKVIESYRAAIEAEGFERRLAALEEAQRNSILTSEATPVVIRFVTADAGAINESGESQSTKP